MNHLFAEQPAPQSKINDRSGATKTMKSSEKQDISTDTNCASAKVPADQEKCIDFVLAYIDNGNLSHEEKREIFEKDLMDQGLELEYEKNHQLCFVKIHAPQEVLCRYCEIMKLRMPIKALPNVEISKCADDHFDNAHSWVTRLFSFVQLDPTIFPKRKYQLASEFSRDKDYLFDIENENFFTTNVRIMIVDFILERQSVGIHRLVADRAYSAAYPLHDGTYKKRGSKRALLYNGWGTMNNWFKRQPLNTIKDYFGINFAIYFSWLGFYTLMLIPASIAGILSFLYGSITLSSSTLAQEACSDWAGTVIMCPQCDKICDYWRLNQTCLIAKATHLFDNYATTIFAIFMSFWSMLYIELWRRRSKQLSYRWGLVSGDVTAEQPRPQYLMLPKEFKKLLKIVETTNTITRVKEPRVSFWKFRVPATCLSFSVVILLAVVTIAAVFAVVLYRMSMLTTNKLFGHDLGSLSYKTFIVPSIAAILNLACILVLNRVYNWVAVYLTEFEMLRTQTEFDDSLALKIYLFQFVNYYASLFYVAFLKGKFIGYPRNYKRIFQFRQEECAPGGCLMELCIQLAIVMVGKQALFIAMGMLWPILFKWWAFFRIAWGLKQKDIANRNGSQSQWIQDLKLLVWSPRGLYDEYLETVIQFGFITIFAAAFPLAPLFALVNNIIEMRLNATKFLRHYRRPVPRPVRGIGIWKQILHALAKISITTNAFIIAFSSNLIPRLVYMAVVNPNNTDIGFLNSSLAYFNTAHFISGTEPTNTTFPNLTSCRYSEYRNPPDYDPPSEAYKRPTLYWRILVARLAFVVVFQNVVGLVTIGVQWCLAGVPRKLSDIMKREAYLTEKVIIKREAERARDRSPYACRFSRIGSDFLCRRKNALLDEVSV